MNGFSARDTKLNRSGRICLLFLGLVLSAFPAEGAEPKPGTKPLDLGKMTLLERQRWALSLLDRLDRANRVILDPKYVDRQHQHFDELAQPLVLGTSPEAADRIAQAMRDEVEKSERIAIEHLDRRFRQALGKKFADPAAVKLRERWFEGWKKTVQAWQKSGERSDQLDRVIGWLEASRASLDGPRYTVVTPVPSFADKAEAVVATEAPKEPQKVVMQPTPETLKTPEIRELPGLPDPEELPGLPDLPGLPQESQASQDRTTETEQKPEPKPEAPVQETAPVPDSSTPIHVVQKPVVPPASPSAVPSEESQGLAEPQPERPALDINLPELAAQVSGNNLALRRLEAQLLEGGEWNSKRMDPVVEQLKQVSIRLGDAQMVYRLLSPSQQKQINRIGDPAAAIKSLRSKIRAARVAALESRGPSSSLTKEQRVELGRLDELDEALDSVDRGVEK